MTFDLKIMLEKRNDKGENIGCYCQNYHIRLGKGEAPEIATQRIRKVLQEYFDYCSTKI